MYNYFSTLNIYAIFFKYIIYIMDTKPIINDAFVNKLSTPYQDVNCLKYTSYLLSKHQDFFLIIFLVILVLFILFNTNIMKFFKKSKKKIGG